MPESLLDVTMQHRVGSLALDVSFRLTGPWTVLFGASGSGKTTVLRAVQGFVQPYTGRIVIAAQVVTDRVAKVNLAPHRRQVRSAAQAARLFPGKTVRENVCFGAEPSIADEVLAICRLQEFAGAMPGTLSGGERQRVSVARAVASAATSGTLLLLDEPFGGLDLALRDALAIELRDWLRLRGVPVLSVTHDVGEVFLLGAEVIRLVDGRIVEQGPVEQVLAKERDRLLGQLGAGNLNTQSSPHV
ncbi:ATP-binding cassette domain-containing protein [Granulicella arctica]|uniref:ATP-binding cassette domain-containing protein n=1 Tax=Granulicella arctica TaxID=940613 RepID=UPI0021DF67E2|nr:ATP-binding cassette domain-containing protein [Granulicella arctica]